MDNTGDNMSDTTRVTDLQTTLDRIVAPWVAALQLRVVEASDSEVTAMLPVDATLVHGGGVLCGQATMAAADTVMILAVSAAVGGFRPMTTVQLQTSFLRPVPKDAGDLRVVAKVLRKGKQLVFGEIEVLDREARLVAHATTTYALL